MQSVFCCLSLQNSAIIMPEVVKNAINGLEFPKIKGGSSYVVTHMGNRRITAGKQNAVLTEEADIKNRQKEVVI